MTGSNEWESIEEIEALTPEELAAEIAAEEAALAADTDTVAADGAGPALTVNLQATIKRLEEQKRAADAENARLTQALLDGKAEEMARLDSRSRMASMQAALAAARSTNKGKAAALSGQMRALEVGVEQCAARIAFKERGVDVCVVMDCTGSMCNHIEACKAKALEIMELAPMLHPDAVTRLAFVGYRDFGGQAGDWTGPGGHFRVHDFVDKSRAGELRDYLAQIKDGGGGDAEDVTGALAKVASLSWQSSTRLVVHFGDMPCHGAAYWGNLSGTWPGGNPDGLLPEDQLKKLCVNRIDYHFARITSCTDVMVEAFKEVYAQAAGAATFTVHDYGSSANDFIPVMLQSITTSMRRSYARHSGTSSASSDGGYIKPALPAVYNLLD